MESARDQMSSHSLGNIDDSLEDDCMRQNK